MSEPPRSQSAKTADEISVELSSNRTAMSFARTAMSSDRTLMSVVRTSLSLIGFGFTIFQFFHTLSAKFVEGGLSPEAPRLFGLALIILGVGLLGLGIANHIKETAARRERRQRLFAEGLIAHPEPVKVSNVTVIAVLLLLLGLGAIVYVGFAVVAPGGG